VSVLEFQEVTKVFKSSVLGRYLYRLGPVSLDVRQGEIFGYLGPNGAGKTTTIKLALGLIRPSTGQVFCLDRPSDEVRAREEVGFLPEQPYFYQHLTGRELMEFYGELHGLSWRERRLRARELLELTGLGDASGTPVSRFSKGMLQRVALAQALIGDPKLVIMDEPLSGLDPVGRREVRDLILRLKGQGKTVFLSSHILQDVEMICDRVGILVDGRIVKVAGVREVLQESVGGVEITVRRLSLEQARRLGPYRLTAGPDSLVITLEPDTDRNRVIQDLISSGGRVESVVPIRQTLEDYFMQLISGERRTVSETGRAPARAVQKVKE
jgi:ABC-2 type transport system ATP-binding protein